jgi:hypothetical protein
MMFILIRKLFGNRAFIDANLGSWAGPDENGTFHDRDQMPKTSNPNRTTKVTLPLAD